MTARPLLVADLFCGAGGSSTGARRAIEAMGRQMILVCVNHWDRAIETHSRMHPTARHYCQDVSTVKPRDVVPEGYLDLLMASPTCTYHSRARGGKPTSDQQRQDPWLIIQWLTDLRVKRVIIENVPEYVDWGPVDLRTGKPMKSRRGEYFKAWLRALEALGFRVEWRIINCADHGDATTRRRFFLMARSDGKRITWPAATHSRDGKADMFGQGGLRWRAAREIIDWSQPGQSIFTRKRPLAPKTIQRIHAGAVKMRWPEPFIVVLRNHMDARGIDAPLPAITAGGTHIGLATPVILPQRSSQAPRSTDQPVPTLTTVARVGLVEPFILPQQTPGRPRGVAEPAPTIATAGAHALISPFYGSGSGDTCKPVSEPLDTITTKDRFGLVVPVTHSQGGNGARSTDEPLQTLTTAKGGELAMAQPFVFPVNQGHERMRGHRGVEEPVPTLLTRESLGLTEPGQHYDILFRMLDWRELARAMSFSDADQEYEFAGTKTEITKQIGNAVPVRTATALVAASFHDLIEQPRQRSAA